MPATLAYMTTTELIPVSHLVAGTVILMDGDTVKGTVILVDGDTVHCDSGTLYGARFVTALVR